MKRTRMTRRRNVTTDDLLRSQEEPHRKRRKLQAEAEADSVDPASEEDLLTGDESGEGSDQVKDAVNGEIKTQNHVSKFVVHDRFDFSTRKTGSSVVQFKPEVQPLASFASLGISDSLQSALTSMSITTPTEVQAACIPPLLAGTSALAHVSFA
jgi:ATP-dependent RNA helicase DDX49/DBP8